MYIYIYTLFFIIIVLGFGQQLVQRSLAKLLRFIILLLYISLYTVYIYIHTYVFIIIVLGFGQQLVQLRPCN